MRDLLLGSAIELESLGLCNLKGVEPPMEIFQVLP